MGLSLLFLALLTSLVHTGANVGLGLIAPALPSGAWALAIAAVLALFGLAALVPTAHRAWTAPACLALPVALFGIVVPANLGPLEASLRVAAVGLTVDAVLGGLAIWLFVGGPRHHGAERLVPFLAVVALQRQAVFLGMQVLVPGLVIHGAFALLPIVAARADDSESWVLGSLRAIGRAPGAWAVAWAGTGLVALLSAAGTALVVGVAGMLDPGSVPPEVQLGTTALSSVGTGLWLWVASRLYDRAAERA